MLKNEKKKNSMKTEVKESQSGHRAPSEQKTAKCTFCRVEEKAGSVVSLRA